MSDASRDLAARLQRAWEDRVPIEPFAISAEVTTVADAYAVQRAWAELRAADGERTVGRKIGLTSPGMQRQMGVGEPDFGDLWASRQLTAAAGEPAQVALATFLQPRVEGELAFLMERPLAGPGVGVEDVLAAAAAAAPAIEIVDSRIADWSIKLEDTIADNASYGGFVVGRWLPELLEADLRELPLELHDGERIAVSERGSAVLGSPLSAVAWLANRLGSFGVGIEAGDIVLSGSFGPAVAALPDRVFAVTVPGAPRVELQFT